MNFLTVVKTILAMLPLLIQAVQAVEAAVPQGSPGAAKLDAVKNILLSSYSVASDVTGTFEQLWPALSGTLSGIVTLFNSTGVFRKS